jgi:hypothetical protein
VEVGGRDKAIGEKRCRGGEENYKRHFPVKKED